MCADGLPPDPACDLPPRGADERAPAVTAAARGARSRRPLHPTGPGCPDRPVAGDTTSTRARLRDAAFGSGTGDLPPGTTPRERWLRAVALGGRGRYAAAAGLLAALLTDPATPAGIAAHAGVTLASHRRQQGGHAAARALDGAALRRAVAADPERPDPERSGLEQADLEQFGPERPDPDRPDPEQVDRGWAVREGDGAGAAGTDPDGTDPLAARVDALVGLAADALGLGDPRAAERLLCAADAVAHPSWRPRVRAGWVRAEFALFTGRPVAAVAPAEEALAEATAAGSGRHVLKSRLVLAVARAVEHPNGAAITELDAVADAAIAAGLLPLVWPARLAAADVVDRMSPGVSPWSRTANDGALRTEEESVSGRSSGAARRRHAAAVTVTALYQFSDPMGRRLMGESVWVPQRLPLT